MVKDFQLDLTFLQRSSLHCPTLPTYSESNSSTFFFATKRAAHGIRSAVNVLLTNTKRILCTETELKLSFSPRETESSGAKN